MVQCISGFKRVAPISGIAQNQGFSADGGLQERQQGGSDMRGLKLMFALAGLLFLIRCVVVCYYTSDFNHFVTLEAQRTQQKGQLKGALLNRPRDSSLL